MEAGNSRLTPSAANPLKSVTDAPYRLAPGVCFVTGTDGTAILAVARGAFYSLIGAGSTAWSSIASNPCGVTQATIVDKLISIEPECAGESRAAVEEAVSNMLRALAEKGLIQTCDRRSDGSSCGIRLYACAVMAGLDRLVTGLLVKWRRLVAAALVHFAAFQMIRWVGDYRARRHIVECWPISSGPQRGGSGITGLCTAVDEAATWFPKDSLCLQRASVLTCLLRQHGIRAEMKIGIRKLPFASHAWVEVAGVVAGDNQKAKTFFQVIDEC